MAKMTIEEIEALFTPEIITRLAERCMELAGLKEQPNKHSDYGEKCSTCGNCGNPVRYIGECKCHEERLNIPTQKSEE